MEGKALVKPHLHPVMSFGYKEMCWQMKASSKGRPVAGSSALVWVGQFSLKNSLGKSGSSSQNIHNWLMRWSQRYPLWCNTEGCSHQKALLKQKKGLNFRGSESLSHHVSQATEKGTKLLTALGGSARPKWTKSWATLSPKWPAFQ